MNREPVSRAIAARIAQAQRFAGTNPVAAGTIAALLLLAAVMTVIAAVIYDAVAEGEGAARFDRPVLDWMVGQRTPGRDAAVTAFTDLGGSLWMPIIATALAVTLAAFWRTWMPVTLMALATTGSVLMTVVGKSVVGRTRPPELLAVPPLETSASFPSGHSLNAIVVAGLVCYLVVERYRSTVLRAAAVLVGGTFAIAMGLSRVFLGHHWLTDVLVAWALGLGWLAVVATGHRVWILRTGTGEVAEDGPLPDEEPSPGISAPTD